MCEDGQDNEKQTAVEEYACDEEGDGAGVTTPTRRTSVTEPDSGNTERSRTPPRGSGTPGTPLAHGPIEVTPMPTPEKREREPEPEDGRLSPTVPPATKARKEEVPAEGPEPIVIGSPAPSDRDAGYESDDYYARYTMDFVEANMRAMQS